MTKGYCMIFSSPSYMLVVALYWSCRTWKCLKIGVRYRYLNNNYFLHRSGNCWKLALLLMARRHFAARHFAPKDKMPQDKMPQGHFAPRHFAPNRTKFWKEDIVSQLQNFGGHFAPTFFFAYVSGISWLAIAIDLLFYFATKQEKSNVFKPWKTSSRHFCLALFPFPPSAKWWR